MLHISFSYIIYSYYEMSSRAEEEYPWTSYKPFSTKLSFEVIRSINTLYSPVLCLAKTPIVLIVNYFPLCSIVQGSDKDRPKLVHLRICNWNIRPRLFRLLSSCEGVYSRRVIRIYGLHYDVHYDVHTCYFYSYFLLFSHCVCAVASHLLNLVHKFTSFYFYILY